MVKDRSSYFGLCNLCGGTVSKLSLIFIKEIGGRLCPRCEERFVTGTPDEKPRIQEDLRTRRISRRKDTVLSA
jgi:hypothetical protein